MKMDDIIKIVIILSVGILLWLILKLVSGKRKKLHVRFICSLLRTLVIIGVLIAILQVYFDLQNVLTAVLTGGGLVLAILSFAAQKSLNNILSGIAISLSRPFDLGDKIKIIGYRGSYNDKIEVVYAYFVEKISGPNPPSDQYGPAEGDGTNESPYNVAKAHEVALAADTPTDKVYVRGTIVGTPDINTQYGNATFNISDGAGVATCYRLKAKDGAKFTSVDQVAIGDTVLVEAKIQNYNGTCEPTQGNVIESTNPNF